MEEGRSFDQTGLRAALRDHTAHTHRQLDALVGTFITSEHYKAFLLSSFRLRMVAEQAASGSGVWEPLLLVEDLRSDLADLDAVLPDAEEGLKFVTRSEKLGALYVLEGSALGARVLQRRAEEIGFTPLFGARHLARQTSDNSRWKRFLAVLEDPRLEKNAVLAAAQRVFEIALRINAETAHECA